MGSVLVPLEAADEGCGAGGILVVGARALSDKSRERTEGGLKIFNLHVDIQVTRVQQFHFV